MLYICCSVAKFCLTLNDPADSSIQGLPVHHQPGVHPNPCPSSQWWHPTIILCRPLLLLPSIFHSIRVFSNESALLIRWPKYWNFSFRISSFNEYPELISFRIDWFESPLQFKGHSRVFYNTTVQINQFFSTQLSLWSNSYIHIWLLEKPLSWLQQTFASKVMSLLFNCCLGWS